MRVLLTTDTIGGVWTYTKELTEGLLDRGHTVTLVSFGRTPTPGQSSWTAFTSQLHPDTFRYVLSDTPLEWMQGNRFAYSAAEGLLCELASDADILHTNQFCFGRLPVSIPKIVVAHSDVLSWATACQPQRLESSDWLQQYAELVQAGLLAADAVVAPTKWMLNALAANFQLPHEIRVIPNGRTLPLNNPSGSRTLQAVTVGRLWDPAKGIDLLEQVDTRVPIFVAGERQHESSQAPDTLGSAKLLGLLPDADLLRLLSESSIYLALSVYEPFGLAPLEAALCGCAVVARDLPSFREVWGEGAIYFNGAASLSRALARLADDPEFLCEAQTSSGRSARQLNRNTMTESYLALYRRLGAPAADQVRSPLEEVRAHAS